MILVITFKMRWIVPQKSLFVSIVYKGSLENKLGINIYVVGAWD